MLERIYDRERFYSMQIWLFQKCGKLKDIFICFHETFRINKSELDFFCTRSSCLLFDYWKVVCEFFLLFFMIVTLLVWLQKMIFVKNSQSLLFSSLLAKILNKKRKYFYFFYFENHFFSRFFRLRFVRWIEKQ